MEIFITSSARHSHTRNSVKIHFYCHLSSPDPPCRALCASSIHPNTNLFLAYMSQSKEVVWSLSYEFRSSSSSLRLSFDRNAPSVYKGRILKCFYPNGKFRNTCCVRREVCTIIVYIRIRSLRVKKIEKLLAEPENDQKSESIKVAQISGIIPTAIKLISLHNWLLFGYIKFAWKHFPTFPFSYFFSAHAMTAKKSFYANSEISFIIIFFSLSSASFLLVSLSWLDEIFTINFHATVARQVGEEIFPHLLSELLRLPSPLASSNLNSTHYATIHGRFFFRAQQWELGTNILITRRHNGWFFTSRRFSSAFFFHIFFAVCCVANDDDYGDGGADGIGKAEKKSMNSLTEMCLSSETVSIKRSFRDFGSN